MANITKNTPLDWGITVAAYEQGGWGATAGRKFNPPISVKKRFITSAAGVTPVTWNEEAAFEEIALSYISLAELVFPILQYIPIGSLDTGGNPIYKDKTIEKMRESIFRAIQFASENKNIWERVTGFSISTPNFTIQNETTGWVFSSSAWGHMAWASLQSSLMDKYELEDDGTIIFNGFDGNEVISKGWLTDASLVALIVQEMEFHRDLFKGAKGDKGDKGDALDAASLLPDQIIDAIDGDLEVLEFDEVAALLQTEIDANKGAIADNKKDSDDFNAILLNNINSNTGRVLDNKDEIEKIKQLAASGVHIPHFADLTALSAAMPTPVLGNVAYIGSNGDWFLYTYETKADGTDGWVKGSASGHSTSASDPDKLDVAEWLKQKGYLENDLQTLQTEIIDNQTLSKQNADDIVKNAVDITKKADKDSITRLANIMTIQQNQVNKNSEDIKFNGDNIQKIETEVNTKASQTQVDTNAANIVVNNAGIGALQTEIKRIDGGAFAEWLRDDNTWPILTPPSTELTDFWKLTMGGEPQKNDHVEVIWNDESKYALYVYNGIVWRKGPERTSHIKGSANTDLRFFKGEIKEFAEIKTGTKFENNLLFDKYIIKPGYTVVGGTTGTETKGEVGEHSHEIYKGWPNLGGPDGIRANNIAWDSSDVHNGRPTSKTGSTLGNLAAGIQILKVVYVAKKDITIQEWDS